MSSSARACSCEASCGPAEPSASGVTRRSFGVCAGRRWRCSARRSSRSTTAPWRASCPPGRTSTATPRRAPASTGCARRSCRCRGWRCRPMPGSATCCPAASAPIRRRGWISSAPPGRSYGSGRVPWVAAPGEWPCTSARTWPSSVRRSFGARPPAPPISRSTPPSASDSPRERASSPTCWSTSSSRPRSCRRLCGTSCGRARRPTTRSRRCGRRGSRSHELSAIGRVRLVVAQGGSRLAGAPEQLPRFRAGGR